MSARIIDRSSMLNAITAALPPLRSTLRRRSLIESSLTAPRRVHPDSSVGSVVRRTWAIAASSASSAKAGTTETINTAKHSARVFSRMIPRPSTPIRGRSESSRSSATSSRDRPNADPRDGGAQGRARTSAGVDPPGGDRRSHARRGRRRTRRPGSYSAPEGRGTRRTGCASVPKSCGSRVVPE